MSEVLNADDLTTGRVVRWSPTETLWFGHRRKVLFLYVQAFEQLKSGKWRLMCERRPFQCRIRQNCIAMRMLRRIRWKYEMPRTDWQFAGREFDNERIVFSFKSPKEKPRRVECILKRIDPALTKKQVRHYVALINRAIRKSGTRIIEEDETLKRMWRDLLVNDWHLMSNDFRTIDGVEYCRVQAFSSADLRKIRKETSRS